MKKLIFDFHNIDTVTGYCKHCEEDSILVAIVSEFYRCTNCGADTKQHINGRISYIQLSESDKKFLRNMARKFKAFVERPKPKKRPRRHTKKLNKHVKRSSKKYNRQGRPQ